MLRAATRNCIKNASCQRVIAAVSVRRHSTNLSLSSESSSSSSSSSSSVDHPPWDRTDRVAHGRTTAHYIDAESEPLFDVHGNRVELQFPRCASALDVHSGDGSIGSWDDVLLRGAPPGLSDAEEAQWLQEVRELHTIDQAVLDYRSRFARVVDSDEKGLSSTQLLERRRAQWHMLDAQWFALISRSLTLELLAYITNTTPQYQPPERSKHPPFGEIIAASVDAHPKVVALTALTEARAAEQDSDDPTCERVCAVIDAAITRVGELDDAQVDSSTVVKAMLLGAGDDKSTQLSERKKLVDHQVYLHRDPRGRATEGDGVPAAPNLSLSKAELESLRAELGDDLWQRWLVECRLYDRFHKLLHAGVEKLSEQLAALTISTGTARILNTQTLHGVRQDELCREIAESVQQQYARNKLLYYRQGLLDRAIANTRELTTRLRSGVPASERTVEEDADDHRSATAPQPVSSLLEDGDMEDREMEDGDSSSAARAEVEHAQLQQYFRRLDVEKVMKMSARDTMATVRRTEDLELDKWSMATKVEIGAYLLSKLLNYATFVPGTNEVDRARARTAGGDYTDAYVDTLGDDSPSSDDAFGSFGLDADLFSLFAEEEEEEAGSVADLDAADAELVNEFHLSQDAGTWAIDGAGDATDNIDPDRPSERIQAATFGLVPDHASARVPAFEVRLLNMPQTAYRYRAPPKTVYHVAAHRQLYDTLVAGDMRAERFTIESEAAPMLVPPLRWQKLVEGTMPRGGQLHVNTDLVRTRSQRHKAMLRHVDTDQYRPVLDGLDTLSATGWRVNERVLAIVEYLWETSQLGLPFLPDSPSTVPQPTFPEREYGEGEASDEYKAKVRRFYIDTDLAVLTRRNLHSQRVSARLKLDVAASVTGRTFYFPHNLDFRGRAYAVGPHLQYLGDDLARGLLTFDERKPLGKCGLRWLKVQLANLYGMDKLSLDERVAWTDEVTAKGYLKLVDENALSDAALAWWCEAENPVQTLAVAFELQEALESDDPAAYLSNMPVHMDGSCNGLQHYAALGRDLKGASQVNLLPGDRPADIYAGVRELVEAKVHADATQALPEDGLPTVESVGGAADDHHTSADGDLLSLDAAATPLSDDQLWDHEDGMEDAEDDEAIMERDKQLKQQSERRRLARLLDGPPSLVSRKVVKQTVMTSVYGVTRLGARNQILNRLKDVYADGKFPEEVERKDLNKMAGYLSELTLSSLNENFRGATESMAWLAMAARLISRDANMPVEWVTPLGWPVVQPYYQVKKRRINTVLHNMTIMESADDLHNSRHNMTAPVLKTKQRSGMPPNYVHSLDSSHMLMTANRCSQLGLTFAAVHDSFWTHACDVDTMNTVLREEFVALHQNTGLPQLFEQFKSHYCCKRGDGAQCTNYDSPGPCDEPGCMRVRWEAMPDPPERGELDIEQVQDSTYFFS